MRMSGDGSTSNALERKTERADPCARRAVTHRVAMRPGSRREPYDNRPTQQLVFLLLLATGSRCSQRHAACPPGACLPGPSRPLRYPNLAATARPGRPQTWPRYADSSKILPAGASEAADVGCGLPRCLTIRTHNDGADCRSVIHAS